MMKHDQRSAFAEKLWRDKELPSCFIVIAISFWNIANWQISQYVPSRL
jgi:hypothetical protein